MVQALSYIYKSKRETMRKLMLSCALYTFTHGDLAVCSNTAESPEIVEFGLKTSPFTWYKYTKGLFHAVE